MLGGGVSQLGRAAGEVLRMPLPLRVGEPELAGGLLGGGRILDSGRRVPGGTRRLSGVGRLRVASAGSVRDNRQLMVGLFIW